MTASEFLKAKDAQTEAHVFTASQIEKWLNEYAQLKAMEIKAMIRREWNHHLSGSDMREEALEGINDMFGFPKFV